MSRSEPNREEGVAHIDRNGTPQSIIEHLEGTSNFSSEFGMDIKMPKTCELLGLLHDIGKYSDSFFERIVYKKSEIVDHSTGGAQFIQEQVICEGKWGPIIKQILSLVIMSHHSGLIDIINPEGEDSYGSRIGDKIRSNYYEIVERIKPDLKGKLDTINSDDIRSEFEKVISKFPESKPFYYGLLSRDLLSCLVDADRLDTERFCSKDVFDSRNGQVIEWSKLIRNLEEYLSSKDTVSTLGSVRKNISEQCATSSERDTGVYSLNLPTGSGKTLASLRFAMNHAKVHNMKRVIYVAPYTSIIDQNVKVARSVLGEFEDILLEHHSNIIRDNDDEEEYGISVAADNWESQIIFTTMVQFLNTFFSSGTSSVRRMHNLSRSVLILDEIQSLPIKCISLFNNAVNFLTSVCGSTVVLCTATQPPLDDVKKPLIINGKDLVKLPADIEEVFKRVSVINMCEESLNEVQIAELIKSKTTEMKNVLFIANTKEGARSVFNSLKNFGIKAYHLSTNMCPAHRKKVIESTEKDIGKRKGIVCVSTQLIEAGVDLDFDVVIRSLAGLDSIIQSAGRCNRNGNMPELGEVMIVDFKERVQKLDDIVEGQRAAKRTLRDHSNDPIGEKAMNDFYRYYFESRKSEMDYMLGCDTTLYSMLDRNKTLISHYHLKNDSGPQHPMSQSFKTANKEFKVIDSDKVGVITEYGEGSKIADDIAKAITENDVYQKLKGLQRKGQNYSVELYDKKLRELIDRGLIREVVKDSGIYRMLGCYDESIGFTE